MALQQIIQQNQPMGLAMLGNQLMTGASDYAARMDKDKTRAEMLTDEARNRSERRSDVDSQRAYEQSNFDKVRLLQLADEQRRRGENLDDTQKKAQMENRLNLLSEAEKRGYFDARDIGNMDAENAALAKLQSQLATEANFTAAQPGNAQSRLGELGTAEQAITQKMADVERRLAAQPTVDQSSVANTALQMATQNNGGKTPSREQIQAAYPDALAKAQQEAQIRWFQDKQDAQVQYQILNSQLNTIRQQQQTLTSTFRVAPTASALSPGAPVATPPPPAAAPGNPLGGFLDALNKQVPPPAAAQSPGMTGIQDSTRALQTAPAGAAPMIRQGRTDMLAGEYAKLDEPIASTQAELSKVQGQIQALQSGLTPYQGVNPAPFDAPPAAQGQFMTDLLLKQSALQRQLQDAQAKRTAGKTSLLSNIPAISTPTSYTPTTPPSPGALLSPGAGFGY